MNTYIVYHTCDFLTHDVDKIIGVFSNYTKAREFELRYVSKHALDIDETIKIVKVEVDKDYGYCNDVGIRL